MSHGFTLIATTDTTCPGIDIARFVGTENPLGRWLFQQDAIKDWLSEQQWSSGTRVMLISDRDPLVDEHAPHLTFPVPDAAYRLYGDARASARPPSTIDTDA